MFAMKKAVLACMAALALCSGCIFDDEFWEDDYSSYPSSDDCDCDDEYFVSPPSPMKPPPRLNR